MGHPPRVVSLLPAATEIVAALGMADTLHGVSHECDYPSAVNAKPRVTHCEIHGNAQASDAIDRWVRERLARTGSLYTLDEAALRTIAPDLILTQGLCDVCAPSYDSVAALAATLPGPPQVLNLEPQCLSDILANIRSVGAALGVPERAEALVASLEARITAVRARMAGAPRRRCVVLEWIAPPFANGHWGPELTEIAGGIDPLGRKGADAVEVPWAAVVDAAPEVLVLVCCGYDLARTRADVPLLTAQPGFASLPAAREGRVYAVDGAAYFSRPGPRIIDSLEILAAIIHPERHGGRLPATGVERLALT
jgi:iron complex transport system substrate-binding protein